MMFHFSSVADFISMGGHGPYVWAAYGATVVIMLWLVIAPVRRKRVLFKQFKQEQRRMSAQVGINTGADTDKQGK